ncbi:hypothetical protein ACTFIV_008849 [Dictyostelium citrinum]
MFGCNHYHSISGILVEYNIPRIINIRIQDAPVVFSMTDPMLGPPINSSSIINQVSMKIKIGFEEDHKKIYITLTFIIKRCKETNSSIQHPLAIRSLFSIILDGFSGTFHFHHENGSSKPTKKLQIFVSDDLFNKHYKKQTLQTRINQVDHASSVSSYSQPNTSRTFLSEPKQNPTNSPKIVKISVNYQFLSTSTLILYIPVKLMSIQAVISLMLKTFIYTKYQSQVLNQM